MLKGITILNSYDVITPEWSDTFFPAIVFSFVVVSGIALIIYIFYNSKQKKGCIYTILYYQPFHTSWNFCVY